MILFRFQSLLTCWSARESTPVLKLYYQRTKIQQASGDDRSSAKVVLPENEKSSRSLATTVPVLKLYYQRTKIQPAAGDDRSSMKVVLAENENPPGRRRPPVQY